MVSTTKIYPTKSWMTKFSDASIKAEEGSKTIQSEQITAALGAYDSIWNEKECSEGQNNNIVVSTRFKDEDGKWCSSIGVKQVSTLQEGDEFILPGANGDRFKLVVSRALRDGLDPEAPVASADNPATSPMVSISASTFDAKQQAQKETSSAAPLLMLAGLLGGTFLAVRSTINDLSVRARPVPEPIDEEAVPEALEETI